MGVGHERPKDITQSGHFYSLNQVMWHKYLACPECGNTAYHAFRCPESLLDWDAEVEGLRD